MSLCVFLYPWLSFIFPAQLRGIGTHVYPAVMLLHAKDKDVSVTMDKIRHEHSSRVHYSSVRRHYTRESNIIKNENTLQL